MGCATKWVNILFQNPHKLVPFATEILTHGYIFCKNDNLLTKHVFFEFWPSILIFVLILPMPASLMLLFLPYKDPNGIKIFF